MRSGADRGQRVRSLRVLGAGISTAALLLLLTRASALSLGWHPEDAAMLRLSWRARPERIETCRAPSAEELARTAEHMRQRVTCEGTTASYQLQVEVDDKPVDSRVVRGGGWRNDRPLQLLNEFRLEPGVRRLRVTFDRRETPDTSAELRTTISEGTEVGTFAGRAGREAEERQRSRQAVVPAHLVLDTTLNVEARRVILVTLDSDARLRITTEKD